MKTVKMPMSAKQMRRAISEANGEPVIVTDAGKPLVAMVPIEGADRETLSLSTNPRFLAILRRSLRDLDAGQVIAQDETRRQSGIPKQRRRR